jgi:hypothetical protein
MAGGRAKRSVAAAVLVLALAQTAVACEKCAGPSGGARIDTPDQCRTALLEVKSCHGEDRSFQECLYHFRADGVPRSEVCRAFLAPDGGSTTATSPPSEGGSARCNELSPIGWRRVPCGEFKLPPDLACFVCADPAPEANRTILQAYSERCDRAVVLKACNTDLASAL